MIKCASELKAQCRIEIAKELEKGLISGAIKHAKNNEPFEVGSRKYKGKTYRVFLTVKEADDVV
jgi:hypothetical protein